MRRINSQHDERTNIFVTYLLESELSSNERYSFWGDVVLPSGSSPSVHDRQVVGSNLFGTTFHKPTENSAAHPSEVDK